MSLTGAGGDAADPAIAGVILRRTMIEPDRRWSDPGRKPPYAGLPSFAGLSWSEDSADLDGVDAAILGAPFDWLASDRPGCREGPRAIRVASRPLGPRVGTGVDPSERLRLLDYGDAPVIPYEVEASRAAIEAIVGEIATAGAVPITLGGDHSITLPAVRACAARRGPLGLVQFDSHTDTGTDVYGHADNHGTMMRRLVDEGHVDPRRYAQIGLRGPWPPTDVFDWQAAIGISHFTADEVRTRGIDEVARAAIDIAGSGAIYLSIDIDVLDPAFAGHTGTPEPGGMLPRELLAAVEALAQELDLAGADVVEVVPSAWGTADSAAVAGAGVVAAVLTGIASSRPAL
jgi:agmatinase